MELAVVTAALDERPPSNADDRSNAQHDEDLRRLVGAAQRGDRAAFAKLYERYYRMVHGIALTRVLAHEAQDVAQEVFVTMMKRIHTLREPAGFGGWLVAITRNRATDFARRRKPAVALSETVPAPGDPRSASIETLQLIRSLPEAYHETLILRFVEGLSGPEIAAQTGLTPASVRVNLHRGYCLLREKLARESSP
ncbi:MAG: sigma-70 family RNA polymerase sigma factor [Phycisphaerales bacterium]|nr:sigma-70 family RNA polymerase sigma factor [Phycisphaerales bacterium]